MILFSSLIFETFAATLQAISNGRTDPEPQDFPVERAYRKYVFRLEKKEDEKEWEVVVKAKYRVFHDCNRPRQPGASLTKAPAGYYFLDRPIYVSTAMACGSDTQWYAKVFDIDLENNVFPYNSQSPLVIHAFDEVFVDFETRKKIASDTLQAAEDPEE